MYQSQFDPSQQFLEAGDGGEAYETIPMTPGDKGVWAAEAACGDGTYYTYSVTTSLGTQEAVDPYARSAGVNGDRGMVIDLGSSDPEGLGRLKRRGVKVQAPRPSPVLPIRTALPLRRGGLLSASSSLLSDRLPSLSLQFVRSQPLCPGSYLKPGEHLTLYNRFPIPFFIPVLKGRPTPGT